MSFVRIACLFLLCHGASAENIPLDAPWKREVAEFARRHLQHSAWGVAHSERNYLLSVRLARAERLTVDEDVLLAAAYLHDMGGLPPFAKDGVDHAVRSAELVEPILRQAGFPAGKIPAVKSVILAHTYYNPKNPVTAEETVFRDADVLDFLGTIGVARILSVTSREPFAPLLGGAVKMLETMAGSLPRKLLLPQAKRLGALRAREAARFLKILRVESFDGKHL